MQKENHLSQLATVANGLSSPLTLTIGGNAICEISLLRIQSHLEQYPTNYAASPASNLDEKEQ